MVTIVADERRAGRMRWTVVDVRPPTPGGSAGSPHGLMTGSPTCRTVVSMQLEAPSWALDQRAMRLWIAALVTLVAIGAFLTREDQLLSWVFLAPTVAVFWLWTLRPRAAWLMQLLGLAVPPVMQFIESEAEVAMFISVFTVGAVAAYSKFRVWMRTVLWVFLFVMVTLGVVDAYDDFAWQNWLVGSLFAWGAGEIIWRYTHTVDELEYTRSLVADQAALQERRRIARDVHDLVGHSLSVVMMHVSGARHLIHKDPNEAEQALVQAEEAGRQSLAEIRRTVGLLRDETDGAAAVLPSADLSDVPELVNDFTAAGLFVQLDIHGETNPGQVDPATALAGYRIIQEALTNASRHTLGADVSVAVSVEDDVCEITVANTGGETLDLGRGSGFGLISMRERAKSVGGSLLAGPTPTGWTVEASLPVSERVRP